MHSQPSWWVTSRDVTHQGHVAVASALFVMGLSLVALGIWVEDYAQGVTLEIGAALMPFGPLLYGEEFSRRRVNEVKTALQRHLGHSMRDH